MTVVMDVTLNTLIRDGYALMREAAIYAAGHAIPQARRDAPDVPIDPNGGLPWAYDVYAHEYPSLTDHAVRTMQHLGAKRSRVTRVTLIKKAAGEGRRYWHNDEASHMPKPHGERPREVLVLYYLTSTATSGCLVVRPGFVLGPCHDEHNAQPMKDEIHVPAEIGDVVLMDPRTQHASLENRTHTDRLLIRVWTENEWA